MRPFALVPALCLAAPSLALANDDDQEGSSVEATVPEGPLEAISGPQVVALFEEVGHEAMFSFDGHGYPTVRTEFEGRTYTFSFYDCYRS